MTRVQGRVEQAGNQPLAFLRVLVRQELADFHRSWYTADQIKVDAAQKLRVVRHRRGRHVSFGPFLGDQVVDTRRQSGGVQRCERLIRSGRCPARRRDNKQGQPTGQPRKSWPKA